VTLIRGWFVSWPPRASGAAISRACQPGQRQRHAADGRTARSTCGATGWCNSPEYAGLVWKSLSKKPRRLRKQAPVWRQTPTFENAEFFLGFPRLDGPLLAMARSSYPVRSCGTTIHRESNTLQELLNSMNPPVVQSRTQTGPNPNAHFPFRRGDAHRALPVQAPGEIISRGGEAVRSTRPVTNGHMDQCPKSGWTTGDFAGVLPIAAMIGTLLIAPLRQLLRTCPTR